VEQKKKIPARFPGGSKRFLTGSFVCIMLFCNLVPEEKDAPAQPYELKYPANFGGRFEIPADNPLTEEGVELGRMLFYETRLSVNKKISCESCHQQRLAFTDGRTFSEGVDNTLTPRNSMSLANLLWVRNFFWDGRVASLESQATFPLTDPHEMGQSLETSARILDSIPLYRERFKNAFGTSEISPGLIVKAISQFERTLISANSRYDQYLAGNYKPTERELNGMALFMNAPVPEKKLRGANCGHCHGGPKTYRELFHNNGLDTDFKDAGRQKFTGKPEDIGRFRVPTLRNVALTAPYMHDGRFTTLEQVLDHYNEHIQQSGTLSSFLQHVSNEKGAKTLKLTTTEKADIIAFLHMLTDSSFISNPSFSNPHVTKH
jgi:cytochrome c peroxidase